jgi:hypothetical protein
VDQLEAKRDLALRVPCTLCGAPVQGDCVNSVDGSPRAEPHDSRVVAGVVRRAPF